jgi:hypothetical protein
MTMALLLLLAYSVSTHVGPGGTATSSSSSSSSPGSLAQQLLSQLGTGPEGQLMQQYILPRTDWLTSLSAKKLPLLLQGTNFTSLSTAAVLDAASSLSSQQKWQLAKAHQRLFCA